MSSTTDNSGDLRLDEPDTIYSYCLSLDSLKIGANPAISLHEVTKRTLNAASWTPLAMAAFEAETFEEGSSDSSDGRSRKTNAHHKFAFSIFFACLALAHGCV